MNPSIELLFERNSSSLSEVRAATLPQSKTNRQVVEFTLAVAIKRARDKDEDAKPGPTRVAGAKP